MILLTVSGRIDGAHTLPYAAGEMVLRFETNCFDPIQSTWPLEIDSVDEMLQGQEWSTVYIVYTSTVYKTTLHRYLLHVNRVKEYDG